jgi:hypothetical protein
MAISFVFDSERSPVPELVGASVVRCSRCDGAVMSNSVINFGMVEVDGEVRAVPMLVQPSWHFECENGHVSSRTDGWWEAVCKAADGLSERWSREVVPEVADMRDNLRRLPEYPGVPLPDDVA